MNRIRCRLNTRVCAAIGLIAAAFIILLCCLPFWVFLASAAVGIILIAFKLLKS
ncbi:MAG: hypothetical protein Q4C04_06910 [Clostridia bacterium]|nr:hypothetical protein [Clostridia bacterium]